MHWERWEPFWELWELYREHWRAVLAEFNCTGEYWEHCAVLGTLRAVLGSTGEQGSALWSTGKSWAELGSRDLYWEALG